MKSKKLIIFLFPHFSSHAGYGHIKRCQVLYKLLKNHYSPEILFYKKKLPIKQKYSFFSSLNPLLNYIKNKKPAFVILDFMFYNKNVVKKISMMTQLVIMDSTKIYHNIGKAVYINSTTPLSFKYLNNNTLVYEGMEYLPLTQEMKNYSKKKPFFNNNVFICFGNSDPNQLSIKILKILNKNNFKNKIILNIGKFFNTQYRLNLKKYITANFNNYYVIKNTDNIIPFIYKCYYLITSFSITGIEGILLLRKVGLYNNSCYHTSLSKTFNNFFYLGTYPYTLPYFIKKNLNLFFSKSVDTHFLPLKNYNQNLINIFKQLKKTSKLPFQINLNICPICRHKNIKLILNQLNRQIYHCVYCKSKFLYIKKDKSPFKKYKHSYFNKEYKQQYGKTYIADKENISRMALNRLKIIVKLLKGQIRNKKILDIGCAYGFFLKRAKTMGFISIGIEIEKNAVCYSKTKLKIKTLQADFLKYKFKEKFNVITLWYVIEHFKNQGIIINKIKTILKPGGLLCLSVPNGNGPFYWFNKKQWLETHPDDHFFDYSLKGIKIFLKKNGFKLIKKQITGFHPERYIGCPGLIKPLLKLLKYGDTMELYFKQV